MSNLTSLRKAIRDLRHTDERVVLSTLQSKFEITKAQQVTFSNTAAQLVENIRADDQPGLMEVFLNEYGLSSDEGVALMCMAEALLRIPDTETMDDLIEDKIAPSSWGEHLGKSSSSLVNASTWALMLTGKILDTDHPSSIAHILHKAVKRLGEPVIRSAVKQAMKEMGKQFVLGETIDDAIVRGGKSREAGFTYSYDMLGEAAITERDARRYFETYKMAIERLASNATSDDIKDNPGISVKLSALHPRYEFTQRDRVMSELFDRILTLTLMAKAANIGLNIDAEEANRLDISLDIIEAVLSDPRLEGWAGFGVVVQAYGKSCSAVIDWLYALAQKLDRKIMIRLVKGAYWDTEIKQAQVLGLASYPVFTRKSETDVSYVCCAKQLLGLTDFIYPQFATHNAHSIAAILDMASDRTGFEFQRLHGMGSVLHRQILQSEKTRCRIYAPVGRHKDLLAYLVRRLLENGANSSFVNQIVDESISPAELAKNPFDIFQNEMMTGKKALPLPEDIYAPYRQGSKGWDILDYDNIAHIERERACFQTTKWDVKPILKSRTNTGEKAAIINPANPLDRLGTITEASETEVKLALKHAKPWSNTTALQRATILNLAADLYEENFGEIFAILSREAGKVLFDVIAEIREASDFLRYYASQTIQLDAGDRREARGIIACISPWNFPLAIFTGQIAAALAAGNGVIAKPAETTPIIAARAVQLLHKAGVPKDVLQFLPGQGSTVGKALVSDPKINGVCFTGSTQTAQIINKNMAEFLDPMAPLIAETGGLNTMIVDSTALPEQAVTDIIASAFQSAGQRCSALRLLYVQSDIAQEFIAMLQGAMDELKLGDPWELKSDIGPIIDAQAQKGILDYIDEANAKGQLLKTISAPENGYFVGPTLLSVTGIKDVKKEIFGPVLHIAEFEAHELPQIIDDINQSGYGLTFGLHTRIDNRVEYVTQNIEAGNIYVNRNQIGAVVGTQPFGGEKLSGTGPKAGGPHYVKRFMTRPELLRRNRSNTEHTAVNGLSFKAAQTCLDDAPQLTRHILATTELPGPTGESNRLSEYPRGTILCLGPSATDGREQAKIARSKGCMAVSIYIGAQGENTCDGFIDFTLLETLTGFDAVAFWGPEKSARLVRTALAKREGPICALLGPIDMAEQCILERHICIDTTASGGNVALLSTS